MGNEHFEVDQERINWVLDTLLARWAKNPQKRKYPFNRKDAVIPQLLIPDTIRKSKLTHSCFYFYACIYMRGGIKSLQVFKALIRMWSDHPTLFDPLYVRTYMNEAAVQKILKKYIGWDSEAAARYWVYNSKHLASNHWGGNPLLLVQDVGSYDEALLRIRNKRTKKEQRELPSEHSGFYGFQPKMVSMLLYFFDYEGWLKPRFVYPTPADFQNFRLALATEGVVVKGLVGHDFRVSEKLSKVWREAMVTYIELRKVNPLDVSDAVWLFPLVMCGNSPATTTKTEREPTFESLHYPNGKKRWKQMHLLETPRVLDLEQPQDLKQWMLSNRNRELLMQTCLSCPLRSVCKYGIPAKPYYTKGILRMRPRTRAEDYIDPKFVREPTVDEVIVGDELQHILDGFHKEVSAGA